MKEDIKAPRHWPLCGEFTGDRWIPPHKWPVTRKMFPFDDVIMHMHFHLKRVWHCLQRLQHLAFSQINIEKGSWHAVHKTCIVCLSNLQSRLADKQVQFQRHILPLVSHGHVLSNRYTFLYRNSIGVFRICTHYKSSQTRGFPGSTHTDRSSTPRWPGDLQSDLLTSKTRRWSPVTYDLLMRYTIDITLSELTSDHPVNTRTAGVSPRDQWTGEYV